MVSRKSNVGLLLLLAVSTTAVAQNAPDAHDFEELTDGLLAYPDEEADYESLYENIVRIVTSRIDLNKADRGALERLYILTDEQIENILHYRERVGPLIDVHELQAVPGLDVGTIRQLLPRVIVKDPRQQINQSLVRRMRAPGHTYLVTRWQRTLSPVDDTDDYRGSPDKLTFRLRSSVPGDFSMGFTGEKDAGEPSIFDYASAHLQLLNKGWLKNIIVGDFQAQFGQGMVLGGGFGLGKGGVATLRKSSPGFLPYTSVNENAARRGIAFTVVPAKSLAVSAFVSRMRKDGRLSAEADNDLRISSLLSSGYHRTPSEIETRKSIRETSAGMVINYHSGNLDAGVISHGIAFDFPVRPKRTLYNSFAFAGRRSLQQSIFLDYRFQNLSFFSEAAYSTGGGSGLVTGVLISLARDLDMAVLFRRYTPDYHAFYAHPFSENTRPQNETGWYWGGQYKWQQKLTFRAYVDLFTFPWLAFRRYAPSSGREWMVRAQYSPQRKIAVRAQMRSEAKDRNRAPGNSVYKVSTGIKRSGLVQVDYHVEERLRLKSRVQWNSWSFEGITGRGITVVQDVIFRLPPFRVTARHALFDTDSYDNRHYVYENDAWLAYSFPAYYGRGIRNYVLLEAKINRRITVWMRYGRTARLNLRLIAAESDEIPENSRKDVKFQLRITF